jgi:PleD family two-component response regulator
MEVIVARVREKLSSLALQRRLPVTIECSTGIAWSQNPPDTADDFLREADRDMHQRKTRARESRGV